MYGISEELPFASFVGEECSRIGLGQFQIQFDFSGGRRSICAEGRWELRGAEGQLVDQAMPHHQREGYYVHPVIDQAVRSYVVDAPSSFTLQFENGYTLTIYDDQEQYECFSLHTEGQSYYI